MLTTGPAADPSTTKKARKFSVFVGLLALISVACDPGVITDGSGPLSPTTEAGAETSVPTTQPVDNNTGPATTNPNPDTGSGPDTGTGTNPQPQSTCDDRVLQVPSGYHNPGTACQGCHGPGGNAPLFTLAGTLYNSGGAALSGATVTVTDANQQQYKIVSGQNGNFYTGQQMAFPIAVEASLCPDTKPMLGIVQAPGDCNSCHNAGNRIQLP